MTDSPAIPVESPKAKQQRVFICYRRRYDLEIARSIRDLVDNGRFDVVFDEQETPGKSDWYATLQEQLEGSQCLIVICTPHLASRKQGVDHAHAEFGWWISNKPSAPVLVIPGQYADSDTHFVPSPIRDKWPNATPIQIPSADVSQVEFSHFREKLFQSIEGESKKTIASEFETITRQNEQLRRNATKLQTATVSLAIFGLLLTWAVINAWGLYRESQISTKREQKRASTFAAVVSIQDTAFDGLEIETLDKAHGIASPFLARGEFPPIGVFRVLPEALSSFRRAHRICGDGGTVMSFAVSPCQQWVVAIHRDGKTRLYSLDRRVPPTELPDRDNWRLQPRFYSDRQAGLFVITSGWVRAQQSSAYEIRARLVPSGRVLTRFQIDGALHDSPSFHASLRQFVTLNTRGILRRHDIDGNLLRESVHNVADATFTVLSPSAESYAVRGTQNGQFGIHRWIITADGEIPVGTVERKGLVSAGYSLDGSLLVTSCTDHAPELWEANSDRLVCELDTKQLLDEDVSYPGKDRDRSAFVFSERGDFVASDSSWRSAIFVWSTKTGELIHRIAPGVHRPMNISFSSDGKFLASVNQYGAIIVWDAINGVPMHEYDYSPKEWTPDSQPAAGVGADEPDFYIQLVGSTSPQVVATRRARGLTHFFGRGELAQHVLKDDRVPGTPVCASMSSDDKRLASLHVINRRAVVAIWNPDSGELLTWYDLPEGGISSSPKDSKFVINFINAQTLAVANTEGGLFHVTLDGKIAVLKEKGLGETHDGLSLDLGGKRVLSQHFSGFQAWDLATGAESLSRELLLGDWKAMAFAMDESGSTFAIGSDFPPFATLFPKDGKPKGIALVEHSDLVRTLSFSRRTDLLATGCDDGKLRLWSASTGRLIATLEGHFGRINHVSFSPNDDWLVSAGANISSSGRDEHSAILWHVPSRKLAARLTGHREPSDVGYAGFSADSKKVYTVCADGFIRIFQVDLPSLLHVAQQALDEVSGKRTATPIRKGR